MSRPSPFAEEYEFHHLAQRPLYRRCPEWLLEHAGLGDPPLSIVDLGCGSGSLTQLLLQRFRRDEQVRIVAMDPSEPELKIARSRIPDERVAFVEGRAQDLGRSIGDVDAVLMCNVLHQIPVGERLEVFRCVHEALKPGGTFAFNTFAYEGATAPGTERFYALWMLRAFEELSRRGIETAPVRTGMAPFQWLTAEAHRELLVTAGFPGALIEEPVFAWSVEDWKAVSCYSVFIEGTLGTVDLDVGRAALQVGVVAAYEELELTAVPRRWLHVAARRGSSS